MFEETELTAHHETYRGIHPIVPTAFRADGTFDAASQRRLVDYLLEIGVQGIAILGFLGEAHKLTEAERREVIETVIDQAQGRLKVLVGVRALGTAGAIAQAREAKELGADAVFAAPLTVQNDNALYAYYRELAEASGIPVLIHDFPENFGTILAPSLITKLANEVPGIVGIKLEEPPVLVKTSQVLEGAPQLAVLGGLGGVYFLEEMQRGAVGIMTGFAYPEVLLDIWQRFTAGDKDGAARVFDHYTPLLRYEFQPKIGLAFRKHVFWKRGIFESDYIRPPGPKLDDRSRTELEATIARVGLSLEAV